MRLQVTALEYLHPNDGKRWVAAWDDLSEAIEWIRKYPTVEVTKMFVGDGHSVANKIRVWIQLGAEEQAIQEPDTTTNVRPEQERRGINLPETTTRGHSHYVQRLDRK